jgi:hypothetical protein
MKAERLVLLACLLVLSSESLAGNDPYQEFSITANPNRVWSYGLTTTLGGAFTPFPEAHPNYLGVQGSDIWNAGPSLCGDQRAPEVGRIQEQLFLGLVPVPPDTLYVHPGCSGQYSIVRWTAPLAGKYQIRGSFPGLVGQISTTDVHILLDSVTSLLSKEVKGPGDAALFNLQQQVRAGDTLDFAVGFGNDGNYFGDSMGLQLTIDLLVNVDIQPGQFPNIIQANTPGSIPVAILSSSTFNAVARIDATSLTFGRIGDENSLEFRSTPPQAVCQNADVNGDGRPDLVCQFRQKVSGFQAGDSVGIVRGRTYGGISFEGTDSVVIQ